MRKRMWIALLIIAGLILTLFFSLAWQVNDWSRDFMQNRAATDADAPNE